MSGFTPGLIALLGSGETAPSAGMVYDVLTRTAQAPLKVAILETPAGFQPNAERVAGKVAEYLATRLQALRPQTTLLPARARGTAQSPDNPATTEGLRDAGLIFLGPGSPTYTVRQLQGSLAWARLVARQRRGVPVVTASAATIAMGALALPVYEIYKVGAELHWQPGLDLLRPYGLALVFVPHWDNAEGGAELDTSRCFMGRERFARLLALLPDDLTVVGIDEHTGLVLDLGAGVAHVLGRGGVTLVRGGVERRVERKRRLPLTELGPLRLPAPAEGLDPLVWADMATVETVEAVAQAPAAPAEVLALVAARQDARASRDWAAADTLRGRIAALGWQVQDTPAGPVVAPAA
jgi:cyanophycinase-like exopeptidase